MKKKTTGTKPIKRRVSNSKKKPHLKAPDLNRRGGIQTEMIVSDYIESNFSINAVAKKRKMDFRTVKDHLESQEGKNILQFYSDELRRKTGPAFEKLMKKCAEAIDKPLKPIEAARIIMDAVGLSVGARQAKAIQAQRAEKTSEGNGDMSELKKEWDLEAEKLLESPKRKSITPHVQ